MTVLLHDATLTRTSRVTPDVIAAAHRARGCGRPTARAALDGHAVAVHLTDALDDSRRQLLRTEVGRLRARESRRVFDPMVYVGALGGPRSSFVLPARDRLAVDDALRADIVGRLLEETPPSCRTVWLVRPGRPELHDDDLRWLAAARLAFGSHGRGLDGCYALTRSGWLDVAGDESRVWVRLRL